VRRAVRAEAERAEVSAAVELVHGGIGGLSALRSEQVAVVLGRRGQRVRRCRHGTRVAGDDGSRRADDDAAPVAARAAAGRDPRPRRHDGQWPGAPRTSLRGERSTLKAHGVSWMDRSSTVPPGSEHLLQVRIERTN
jgi:hypothetical protein